ncbi:MAG: hypothetical protein US83_C0002G0031 [Candidatus Falkowbacteria bacterium GW2011_GWC2_38_22]|uniref:Uncharacterized protein n=1 Tax=Candidatus Falkowbacteria bacterium GW2011_GWE1_38_31 TaxID=1618638 RepID=A0A0G0N0X1_9BACT|nr:MAG: hypothetical protein US73_C0007G0031 [Candidatus Falkowbacteria bacterium GW2011_GWF2_38_1205]KKQ61942.1 MAG: hypothetical protein US83_C0002G0031 [Candidatus Falkowbacteria bacterium GW2011_GWC2_38_22]KKQ63896.1 MAG: hypothetical protein US84_C0003G0086 [Candidatus Falkowbacteria bacterium GW2011_GWF1_38_22]KKQ66153.1 MAG: hypothetical protein US87_C0003G0086 [Candidatus Falkowbacteria bacterium GW2011_GWE2_38_254]KKQ70756.1 MAG: hypothetical protein US91_C0003G0086 [Candidatus Falkowb
MNAVMMVLNVVRIKINPASTDKIAVSIRVMIKIIIVPRVVNWVRKNLFAGHLIQVVISVWFATVIVVLRVVMKISFAVRGKTNVRIIFFALTKNV